LIPLIPDLCCKKITEHQILLKQSLVTRERFLLLLLVVFFGFFSCYFFPDFEILLEPGLFKSVFFSRFFKLRSIFLIAFVQWIRNAGARLSRADVVLEKIEFFFPVILRLKSLWTSCYFLYNFCLWRELADLFVCLFWSFFFWCDTYERCCRERSFYLEVEEGRFVFTSLSGPE
jgi:hypothetical protein